MSGPIDGVRIFDLTVVGVGPLATTILANMGANVVTVEQGPMWPPAYQGSPPTYHGMSMVYTTCHMGKRGIYLDLKDPQGKEQAYRLLQDADVFAENMSYGTVQRLGLTYEKISERNPRIIYGNFPGWGPQGPYADRGSADGVAQVFSGSVSMNGKRGGDQESLRWPALHDWNASSHITLVLLLGLLYRERTGNGLSLMTPQIGASVNVQATRLSEYLATREVPPRMGSATTNTVPHRAYICRDKRWLAVGVVKDDQWVRLCKAIGAKELLENKELAANGGRVKNRELVDDALGKIFSTKMAKWWEIQLHKAKVPASLFLDYRDIPDHPQVRANKHFVWLRYPRKDATARVIEYPGIGKYPKLPPLPFGNLPFQYSKTPVKVEAGMLPGAHTQHILEEGWGGNGNGKAKRYYGPTAPMKTGVLDGVTVVDMTQGISGPFASLMLAHSGARVIKIEPPEGDYTRGWEPQMNGVSSTFFHLNRNKEGMHLDLANAEDRERLRGLLKEANIFLEEEGQAKLKRWGLDQDSLEKANPGIITCSISSFGEKGPLRNQPASELVLQAMSDYINNLGVPGEEPVRLGADMASAGTSLFACHAILGALYHQWRTGVGQRIAISQLGTLLFQRAIQWTNLIDPDEWNGYLFGYFKPPEYPYKAKDQSITIGPSREVLKMPELMKELGMHKYLDDPLFKNPPAYIMGYGTGGALDTGDLPQQAKPIWEEALSKFSAEQAVAIFLKYGANATLVNDYQQLYDHPQTKAMGLFTEVDDPKFGKIRYQQPPWRLDGVPMPTPTPFQGDESTPES